MSSKRIDKVNSLLKEVISEVIARDVRNPRVNSLVSVLAVSIAKDLHNATVYISVIGSEQEKEETLAALQSASGFISVHASKKVTLRYFPSLTFSLDSSIEEHLKIHQILEKIHDEKQSRSTPDES
jgi:ribosome-binding factor A